MLRVSANGADMPAIGLGTWQLSGEQCVRVVGEALACGYRHIDTAQMYGNEREVGEGLRASGVPRDEVFVTTKIWPDHLKPGVLERAAEERLTLLGLDRVDLLLIHWPSREVPVRDSIASLAAVRRAGLARHIGVSNFSVALIEEAVAASPEPLAVNQVEYHPFLDQSKVIAACRRHGMALTAYCPLAKGRVAEAPAIRGIAERHGRTPAQIALRWLVQQGGIAAIPKTATRARLVENLAIEDFTLDDGEMAAIAAPGRRDGRLVATAWAPDWDD